MIHGYWLKQFGIEGAYELKDLTPEAFQDFIGNLAKHGFVGGNITVPHKEAAFQLVDHREAAAEAIGAVNTVWLDGPRLMGGNSDAHGFIANLDETAPGWDVENGHAVVLFHGMNVAGFYWGGPIEVLRKEGFRVVVPAEDRARGGHVPHLEDPARTYPPLAFLKEGVR